MVHGSLQLVISRSFASTKVAFAALSPIAGARDKGLKV